MQNLERKNGDARLIYIKTELRKIQCGQRMLEYLLMRKQVKNINLRVKPEGKVYVSANVNVSVKYIDDFVKSKQVFIFNALDKFEENRKNTAEPKKYVSGEIFHVLGKSLQLKISEGKEESITTDGVFLYLMVKGDENYKRKEKIINNWLTELQSMTFEQICKETYQIFKKYDVEYPLIKVKTMTSRWGSCHAKKGIITLNSKLIEAPRNCIEYVVLHEFAHFIHPNHSKSFYNFVAMLMPDWKERKKALDFYDIHSY